MHKPLRLLTRASVWAPYSAPHASSACMDMISLRTAAMVVFIMSHRLEALSKKPMRTSLSSGSPCGVFCCR